MFKKNEKDNIPLSSDAVLYDKYKKIELFAFIFLLIGGILAAIVVGTYYGYPEVMPHSLFMTFTIIGIVIIIISFIIFTIYYFKMKKMRE